MGGLEADTELAAVIERSMEGDLKAFEVLVGRFQDMAVGYAYSILGDFHLAQDAAQDAFVDAHRNIAQLRDARAFSSWLRRIVFKHCDRVTRRKGAVLVPVDLVPEQPSDDPDPLTALEKRETGQIVRQALAQLSESSRAIVTLYYMTGHTQAEIAAYLGISRATVKRRLRDGRRGLQQGFLHTLRDQLHEQRPSRNDRMKEQVMEIIAGSKQDHSEAAYSILEDSGRPGQFQWREGRIEHSHVDWSVSRMGTVGGEMIAAYGIFDMTMRIGSSTIRVGGNNWNALHPDHVERRQDIFCRLEAESFDAMRGAGYDMAANFETETHWGIRHTFGWREYIWTINTDQLPAEEIEFALLDCPSDFREDLGALYNQDAQGLTGTVVRPTFRRNKHPGRFTTWYWTDAAGTPLGYVSGNHGSSVSLDPSLEADLGQHQLTERLRNAIDSNRFGPVSEQTVCVPVEDNQWWVLDPLRVDDWLAGGGRRIRMAIWKHDGGLYLRPGLETQFRVDEVAGDPEQILRVVGKLARDSGHRKVVFDRLHYLSRTARRLRAMEETDISVRWPVYYLRVLNLQSLLQKLAPELSARLQDSLLADWSGDLLIANGDEDVWLAIDRSAVTVVPQGKTGHSITGGQEIVQLLVGSDTPDEVVKLGDIKLTGDARHLMQVLFPIQYPQMENQAM
jgi:RNA polymerase sigma factor (sigma-70 family)